jgi:hypothetical protein
MSWLRKIPWLALCLVILSYSVVGWYAASWTDILSLWLVKQGESWGWLVREDTASAFIQISEVAIVCLIAIALTAPVALVTVLVGSGLKSDTKALISMLGWSIILVMIIRWFHYFVHLLVLFCAAILGRLELQRVGYNKWQVISILLGCCLAGMGLGWLIFIHQQV